MREIEIKVRLSDGDDVRRKLRAAGVTLSQPVKQHDVVYCLPDDVHTENDPTVNWLRIRTENDTKVVFTLKRSIEGSLDSIEHETVVEDGQALATMLADMGYVVYNDLTKTRQTAHIADGIELCLDDVPPLGVFMELEKLCEDDVDGALVEAELVALLDSFNVTHQGRVMHGYDELMNRYLQKNSDS